ncbi:N-fatty-acyl-amino acid synthase/hydrolase PM20D1-like [Ornithodoros turicata]|uniref:N-fatty-acyl-amino acid synthase/hydrolase PM20D1-like n=1 Tax=Ornithodoros turicata TaxID=34597 RepID=UPI003139DBA3
MIPVRTIRFFRLLLWRLPSLIFCFLVGLLCVAVIRALLAPKPVPPPLCKETDEDFISESARNLSTRLARALRIRTITRGQSDYDTEPLIEFHSFIKQSFPHVYSSPLVTAETVSNHSFLFTVRGSNPSLLPYMLCAHFDVVPVVEKKWRHPPFDGKIVDGEIWGRGAIDAKQILMGIMEALEFLLERGHQPKRTFYLAFGHDEEGSGVDGAYHIGKLLQARGLRFEYILDEGVMILNDTFPGVAAPVAMVGVTEKGYLTFKITAYGTSIHTSVPPRETTIITLSKAVARFHSQAHPSLFGKGIEVQQLEVVGTYAPFWIKVVLLNQWLFGPIISWVMSRNPIMDSLIRTVSAPTIISGGIKENVCPGEAYAYVNQRVHPLNSIAEVMAYNHYLVRDLNVTLEVTTATEPHVISPHDEDTFGYQMIRNSVHSIFPQAAVAPALCIGSTDTKHYLNLSRAIYRFSPTNITPKQAHRFHGDNERISIWNYERVVNFYKHIILNSDADGLHHRKTSRKSGDL